MNNTEAHWDEVDRLFGQTRRERMQALGHCLVEVRREGSWVFDRDGNRYLDCDTSNVFNLGRRPGPIVEAARRALHETDQGNFPMVSWEKAELARRLSEIAPRGLECTVFSVMRGEAIDCAGKLARGITGRTELLTMPGAWHGETGFALTLSDRPDRERFGPLVPAVGTLPVPDVDVACAAITRRTAAVIIEVVQAENHAKSIPIGLIRALRQRCDRTGTLLVVDETQTGFGRTGRLFAIEHADVVPDVLVVGEALGAGVFPIAATLFSGDARAYLDAHPLIHLSTFGGSDLGCRIGLAALDLYAALRPWVNAARVGSELRRALTDIATRHADSVSIQGQGLLLSCDTGSAERAILLCRSLSENGVLASPGKVARRSVLLRPSLLIGEEETAFLEGAFEKALSVLA